MDKEKGTNGPVQIRALIEEMERRGYELLELTTTLCVLRPRDPRGRRITVPTSASQLSEDAVRSVLREELLLDPEEILDAIHQRAQELEAEREDHSFKIDVAAAIKILQTTPHSPARRSPEDLKAAVKILKRIEAAAFRGDEPTDVSENLDKYLY